MSFEVRKLHIATIRVILHAVFHPSLFEIQTGGVRRERHHSL